MSITVEDTVTVELAEPEVTKYYSFGGQKVAMRQVYADGSSEVSHLHGDHLGSTSLTTDESGNKLSEQRYYPYGEIRPGGQGSSAWAGWFQHFLCQHDWRFLLVWQTLEFD